MDKYKGVNFLIVYCQEAHASDEWPIGSIYQIKQHKTLDDRFSSAKLFIKNFDYKGKLLVDKMNNKFQTEYSSWPTKYYLIKNGKIEYISHPKNATFTFNGIIKRLDELVSN